MRKESGERIKAIGFILIIIGTLGLILNDFVFQGPSAVTISFAIVDAAGLAGIISGGIITRNKASA
jgi:hypothetical protein